MNASEEGTEKQQRVRKTKRHLWFTRYRRTLWAAVLPSLSDPGQINAAIVGMAAAFLFIKTDFAKHGFSVVWDAFSTFLSFVLAGLAAAVFFVVANLVAAGFRVGKDEKSAGKWTGRYKEDFVLHDPKLLISERVTSDDNAKEFPFVVEDAFAGGSVFLRLEFDGLAARSVRCFVRPDIPIAGGWPQVPSNFWLREGANTALFTVYPGKRFILTTQSPNTNQAIVRVFLVSTNIF